MSYDMRTLYGENWGHLETEWRPMYPSERKQPHHPQYVIKSTSKVETCYISYIGTRRNYTSDLQFALTFTSKADAERATVGNERVCLLSEESLYQ